MNRKKYLKHFVKDALTLFASVAAAVFLVRLGVIERFVEFTQSTPEAASFIAGLFFTSVFTIAPAAAALIALSHTISPLELAVFGAAGAAFMDLIIFSFLRDTVARDMRELFGTKLRRRLFALSHFGFMKWLIAGAGAAVIASPFPDEIGLALFTFARLKPQQLIAITYFMNAVGIFALVSVADALM